jgi:fatty acid desaturase
VNAVAVRALVNLVYVAALVWAAAKGQWAGLIVVPFLAYGLWRLQVLLHRQRPTAQQGKDRPL